MKWILSIAVIISMTSSVSNAQIGLFMWFRPSSSSNFLLDGTPSSFLLDGTSGKLIAQ